jgi:hypothetical protein
MMVVLFIHAAPASKLTQGRRMDVGLHKTSFYHLSFSNGQVFFLSAWVESGRCCVELPTGGISDTSKNVTKSSNASFP